VRREPIDPPHEVTAHQSAFLQPRVRQSTDRRGALILLTLLAAVELLWLALIAYLLYRVLY
jgi:hypothetical protein